MRESANTVAGWSLVGFGVLIPVAVAGASRRRRLLLVALGIAAIQGAIWWWALTGPFSDCGSF